MNFNANNVPVFSHGLDADAAASAWRRVGLPKCVAQWWPRSEF